MSLYQASLAVRAPLLLSPSRGGEDVNVSMPLGSSRLPLQVWRSYRQMLRRAPPEGEQLLVLYPRTNAQGYLWRGTTLRSWSNPAEALKDEPGFHALGKLLRVDRAEARLVLLILPNPKGHLPKPFALPLVASLELLEALPEGGSGLEVWGELKARSGRVVVTRAQAVPLPPVKEGMELLGAKAEQRNPKPG